MPRKKPDRKPYLFALAGVVLVGLGWFSGYWWSHRMPEACACMCLTPPAQIN